MAKMPGNRMCGYCDLPVYDHHGKRAGHAEVVTLSDGRTKRQLYHAKRCWPRELRRRRDMERAIRMEAQQEHVCASDDLVMAVLTEGERREEAQESDAEAPAEAIPGATLDEAPAIGPEAAGELVGSLGRPGKHRGLKRAVYQAAAEHAATGEWFSAGDVVWAVVGQGHRTTRDTLVTMFTQWRKAHPGITEMRRVGNQRTYRGIAIKVEAPAEAAEAPRPVRRRPHERRETDVVKAELLTAVDRACADLGMLVAELVAETKQQLRKQIEGKL